MHLPKYFRIGIYGMLLQNNYLLVAHEIIQGQSVVKLPGGGLQFGEGTIDALKREFKEELNISIHKVHHIYTTDFFVQSAFNKDYQVIAIYYLVESTHTLPFPSFSMNNIQFTWQALSLIDKKFFTFDTDNKALQHLLQYLNHKI